MREKQREKQPLYLAVADHVEALIGEGTLIPGTRIPSLRQLSQQLSVSVTTVMEAYRVLEDRGVIEVRPQSGHYVRLDPRSSPPEPSRTATCQNPVPINAIEVIERLVDEASQPGLAGPFGAALPHADLLPTHRINTLLMRAARRDPVGSQAYDSLPGRLELRREIARRALDAGCGLSPDDIVITTGATEAIALALRAVTQPGDTVAIESPTYHGILQMLESLHLRALEIATCPQDGICIPCLEKAAEKGPIAACLVVPSFGNPLGHSMPDEDRRELLRVCSDAGIVLIEDDTYGDLPFADRRPPAIKSFDEGDEAILLSSFSKTLAPGYRIGWMAPGRHRQEVLRQKLCSSIATATPTQMAIADYLASGGFDRHLRKLRRTLKDLVRRMIRSIGTYFPEGTRVTRPDGGYVLWVEMPESVDAFRLYGDALQEGISVIPGPILSATNRYPNCLRMTCATPWSDEIEGAVRRLGELAGQQV